jgi:hypothetical protein
VPFREHLTGTNGDDQQNHRNMSDFPLRRSPSFSSHHLSFQITNPFRCPRFSCAASAIRMRHLVARASDWSQH